MGKREVDEEQVNGLADNWIRGLRPQIRVGGLFDEIRGVFKYKSSCLERYLNE